MTYPSQTNYTPTMNWGDWNYTLPTQYMPQNNLSPVTTTTGNGGFWDSFNSWMGSDTGKNLFGYVDPKTGVKFNGAFSPMADSINGAFQSWLGMQQLGLAQDQFDFKVDAWNKEYDNQVALTNERRVDRQNARLAAAPGSYQSVGDYMASHKVG